MGGRIVNYPSIDQSVGLLNLIDFHKLENLRNKHPEYRSILELGEIGGPRDNTDHEEIALRYQLTKLALETTLEETKSNIIPKLRSKIKRLQSFELWSQIVIVVSSSSLFILLGQDPKEEGQNMGSYIAAGLSSIGALLTIFLKKNSGEWAFNNNNIADAYNNIITKRIKAEEILRELSVLSEFKEDNEKRIFTLIEEANVLNGEMRMLVEKYY